MNPEVFLFPTMFTDRYYFVEAVEKTMEFKTTDIVYDKQEKNLFTYKIYNDDYAYEKEAFLKSISLILIFSSNSFPYLFCNLCKFTFYVIPTYTKKMHYPD